MRASRKPPKHVFRTYDRHYETPGRPVDRRTDHQPPWPQECGARIDKGARILNMFDDFHGKNDVKALAGFNKRFHRRTQVPDTESRLFRMRLRHTDTCLGCINSRHIGAEAGHGLAEQSPATADVNEFQLPKRLRVAPDTLELGANLNENVIQPTWVQHVKGTELSVGRPPLRGHGLELRDFLRIGGTSGPRHSCTSIRPRIRAFLHQGNLHPKTS